MFMSLFRRWRATALDDAVRKAVADLERRGIPGAIVECGNCGLLAVAARALSALASTNRQLILIDPDGTFADAKRALMETRYPWEKMHFIQDFEVQCPDRIALLLDSGGDTTAFCQLYNRLVAGGIVIDHTGQPHVKRHRSDLAAA
jgi:hypothetical protein